MCACDALLLYSCGMTFVLHFGVRSDVIKEKASYYIWSDIASEHLLRCIRVCVYILACFCGSERVRVTLCVV